VELGIATEQAVDTEWTKCRSKIGARQVMALKRLFSQHTTTPGMGIALWNSVRQKLSGARLQD